MFQLYGWNSPTLACILKVTAMLVHPSKTQASARAHARTHTHYCVFFASFLAIVWLSVHACALSCEYTSLNVCVCVSGSLCVGNATGPYFPWAQGSAGFSLALSKQFRKNNDRPLYWLVWPGLEDGLFSLLHTHPLLWKEQRKHSKMKSNKGSCSFSSQLKSSRKWALPNDKIRMELKETVPVRQSITNK